MTKRIAVTLLITTVFASGLRAESNFIGWRAGSNFATLITENDSDLDRVSGTVAGLTGVFALTPWLAFQPELLYSVRGTKGRIEVNSSGYSTVEGEVTLKYLELPMLLRLTPPSPWLVKPYLVGGTALAANLSARATGSAIAWTTRWDDEKVDKLVTDGDLELIIGGGVLLSRYKLRAEASVRYTKGILDVEERLSDLTLKNDVWSVMLSLLFDVGGKD